MTRKREQLLSSNRINTTYADYYLKITNISFTTLCLNLHTRKTSRMHPVPLKMK